MLEIGDLNIISGFKTFTLWSVPASLVKKPKIAFGFILEKPNPINLEGNAP